MSGTRGVIKNGAKIILLLGIVAVLFDCIHASDSNPIYVDPLDWRLQPNYREFWIESRQCYLKRDYRCAVDSLLTMQNLELDNQQMVELGRAVASLYSLLSEESKPRNWKDVISFAELSIQFDDQAFRMNFNHVNIVAGHAAQNAWDECMKAVKFFDDPEAIGIQITSFMAMDAAKCFYNVGRFHEAKHWIEFAQDSILEGDIIDDMSLWAQEVNQLNSALEEQDPTSVPILRPFWWDRRGIRQHVLAAIQCNRERNHACAIINLENLKEVDLTDRQRAHVNRALARHYSRRASESGYQDVSDAVIRDLRKAISLHDNPRWITEKRGLVVYLLALKRDWNACIGDGVELFGLEEFVVTTESHSYIMALSTCFLAVGDEQSANKWVATARRLARNQGTFIHESWAWLLERLSDN